MRIMGIGDLHFRARRLSEIAEAWVRTLELAHEMEVDWIVQAGDVMDHANVFGKEATIGTIYDAFLAPFRNHPVNIAVIPGNHDIAGPEDKDALAPVEDAPWLRVFRAPGVYPLTEDLSICAVPWVSRAAVQAKMVASGMSPEEAEAKVERGIASIFNVLAKKVAAAKEAGSFVVMTGHLEVTGALLDSGETQSEGAFEFSPSVLASLEADAYVLGHIHRRQSIKGLPNDNDGYAGALCQINFGEENNEPAVRFLEVQNGRIEEDRWIENQKSPRYFTVEKLDEVKYREGVDHVKIRADKRPDVLPEGVIFEKKPERTKAKCEIPDDAIDADAPLDELIEAWAKATDCKVPLQKLVTASTELPQPEQGSSVGSFERWNNLRLANVTCHRDTSIDLSNLSGVIAVDGANGTGKTTAMEAMLVGAYGTSPSRALGDMISTDADGPSVIEVGFESKGKNYVVKREFQQSRSKLTHKGFLYEEGSAIAEGPSAVKGKCQTLIGDQAMVLAGVFSSQGDSGNLLESLPSQRKELFAKLLGSDKFLPMGKKARDQAKALTAKAAVHAERCGKLTEELQSEDEETRRLQALDEEKNSIGSELEDKQEALAATQTELERIREHNLSVRPMAERLKELESEHAEALRQEQAAKKRLESMERPDVEGLNSQLKDAKNAEQELTRLKEELSELREQKAGLLQEATAKQANAADLRAKRSAALSRALREAKARSETLRSERAGKQAQIEERLRKLREQRSASIAEMSMVRKSADLLSGFPDVDECASCPLAKDGLEARSSLASREEELKELEARISKGESVLQDHVAETERLLAEDQGLDEEAFQQAEASESSRLDNEASDLLKQADLLVPPQEKIDHGRALQAKAGSIADLEQQIEQARTIEQALSKTESEAKSLHDRCKNLAEAIAKLRKDLPKPRDEAPTRSLVDSLTKAIADLNAKRLELAGACARQQEKVENLRRKRSELEEEQKSRSECEEKQVVMAALADALERDGIPHMLVEWAIPRFQDLMNELLSEFEGLWSVRVVSQKTNKSGKVEEVIDIPVDDGLGERDIITYSGGERKLLKYVVRIAFAILQAERYGRGLKVLVLDEAVDAIDEERAALFVTMVSKLTKYFNQIFVISHAARILSAIPMKIKFTRPPGQHTQVSVMAAKT